MKKYTREMVVLRLLTSNTHNKFVDCDVSGVDLSGLDLSYQNFSGSNLRGTNLSNTIIRSTNLTNCILTDSDFTGAVLDKVDLNASFLSGVDLSKAKEVVTLWGCVIANDCEISATDFYKMCKKKAKPADNRLIPEQFVKIVDQNNKLEYFHGSDQVRINDKIITLSELEMLVNFNSLIDDFYQLFKCANNVENVEVNNAI